MKEPKLHLLTKKDDVEHLLTTFERMAAVCQWPEATWSIRLVPLILMQEHTTRECGHRDFAKRVTKRSVCVLERTEIIKPKQSTVHQITALIFMEQLMRRVSTEM